MNKNTSTLNEAIAMVLSSNKHGFFTVPCRPGFLVRPYPVQVRR